MTHLSMCACARTKEYCVTKGCKKDKFEWRFSTEGREQDRLRRVIDLRRKKHPCSNWLKPEKAIAEAWLMNMECKGYSAVFITKLGQQDLTMEGVP